METSTKWKYISSKNASKIEVNQNAEVKMITVASRRPNRSSISDSKGGLYTIPTNSKRSHLDAQRCWTKLCMIVAMISAEKSCSFQVFLRSGLAVKWLSRKPLPQKASARDPYIKEDLQTWYLSSIRLIWIPIFSTSIKCNIHKKCVV